MAQREKALRPTGRIDVGLSPVLPEFLARFGAVCNIDSTQFVRGGKVVPGSLETEPSMVGGRFAVDYLWRELLSKYDDGKSSAAKDALAMEKFREGEVQCGLSNARLSRMVGLPVDLAESDIERTMCVARRKVREILGRFSWDHAARGFSFTSGASTRCKRVASTVPHKYSGIPETTYSNSVLAACAIAQVPTWKRSLTSGEGPLALKLVKGNTVTTVPKNYKVNRVIAIEPCMNMYVQKGIGSLIRERLLRAGVNLNNQEVNQEYARYASASGLLATVDLSMASDTVSLELVRFMLPAPWLQALEQCRSTQGVLPDGSVVYYRKFSSMGNGYTFELESLLFYALALACCEVRGASGHNVSVYGDDIIVPATVAPFLVEVLTFAGFKTNDDKTFIEGPFRESCGKHYFYGNDVQPFYIKNDVTKLSDLFLLHNKLWRWSRRQQWNNHAPQVSGLLAWLRAQAPSNWRKPRIPDGVGDGAFIGTFDQCTPKIASNGYEGFVVEVLCDGSQKVDWYGDVWATRREIKRKQGKRSRLFLFTYETLPHDSIEPDPVGRLLQSLGGVGLAWNTIQSTPFEGGVAFPARPRLVKMIVNGYC